MNTTNPRYAAASYIIDSIRLRFDIPEDLATVLWDALAEGFEQQDVSIDVLDQLTKRFRIT